MFDMVPFKRNNDVAKRGDYFDQFFNNFLRDDFFSSMPANFVGNNFTVDLKEKENEYVVEADLPGVSKDAIDIDYSNNYLTISAKREDNVEDKNDNYVRRERSYGEYKRCFYIDNVDEDKIDASFNDGVLKLLLPKLTKGKDTRKKINIH